MRRIPAIKDLRQKVKRWSLFDQNAANACQAPVLFLPNKLIWRNKTGPALVKYSCRSFPPCEAVLLDGLIRFDLSALFRTLLEGHKKQGCLTNTLVNLNACRPL